MATDDERYDMWLASMKRAAEAVKRADEVEARRIVTDDWLQDAADHMTTSVTPDRLSTSLGLITELRSCDLAKLVEVSDSAFEHAQSYWNYGGPHRLVSMPAMVLSRMILAERLLASPSRQQLAAVRDKLDHAYAVHKANSNARVQGFEDVMKRVAASLRKPGPSPKPTKRKPMATRALSKAKSFRRGTVSKRELQSLAKRCGGSESLLEMAGDMASFDGDIYFVDGDLVVDGDFNTSDAAAIWLVIAGDLTVRGLYEDTCNDGPDFVLVEGALRAHDVITAGRLVINNDLSVSGTVVGDYNDGSARIEGDLTARLFVPTDHRFEIAGKLRADIVIVGGSLADRARHAPTEIAWRDAPLADRFDLADLCMRLRAGQPILVDAEPIKPAKRRSAIPRPKPRTKQRARSKRTK